MKFIRLSSSLRTSSVRTFTGLLCFGLAIALAVPNAAAEIITLESDNSTATFYTEAADVGGDVSGMGLQDWVVDGEDHMSQQWFWTRVGSDAREYAVGGGGELAYVDSATADLDGDTKDDIVLLRYADTTGPDTYKVELRYMLTGGTAGSERSDLAESILIRNTGNEPLELNFFQYVDFDLNGTPDNDSIIITGSPANTVRQTDPEMEIAETVVSPPPSHWTAGEFPSIFDALEDGVITTLDDAVGPFIEQDAAWAFQWDFSGLADSIAPGGVVIISKDKNIRPGEHIVPEPSSCLLAGFALIGLLGLGRRKKR